MPPQTFQTFFHCQGSFGHCRFVTAAYVPLRIHDFPSSELCRSWWEVEVLFSMFVYSLMAFINISKHGECLVREKLKVKPHHPHSFVPETTGSCVTEQNRTSHTCYSSDVPPSQHGQRPTDTQLTTDWHPADKQLTTIWHPTGNRHPNDDQLTTNWLVSMQAYIIIHFYKQHLIFKTLTIKFYCNCVRNLCRTPGRFSLSHSGGSLNPLPEVTLSPSAPHWLCICRSVQVSAGSLFPTSFSLSSRFSSIQMDFWPWAPEENDLQLPWRPVHIEGIVLSFSNHLSFNENLLTIHSVWIHAVWFFRY